MIVWWLWVAIITGDGIVSEPVAIFTSESKCQLTSVQLTEHPQNAGVQFYCRKVTKT